MPSVTTFIASLGVNTHVDATSSPYGNVALVAKDLAYLGISHIRDHAWDTDLSAYKVLATGGIKFDLIVDDSPKAAVAAMMPIASSIVSFEGANEVDTSGSKVAAVVAQQAALFAAVKGTPAMSAIPVLNLSVADPANFVKFAGAASAASDVINLHAYAAWGDVPQLVLPSRISSEASATKASVITETGYFTMLNNAVDPSGVDEATQAKLTLDTVFDSFSLGVGQTYLYELLDEGADPGDTNSEMHYGLFHADGSPKPVATAIHNLTSILAVAGAGVTPTLRPVVTGLPASGRSLILTGTDGATFLTLWAEPKIWDTDKQTPIAAGSASVTVDLGAVVGSVSVYDPLLGTGAIATYTNVSRITVSVTDHPLIIRAANIGAAAVVIPGNLGVAQAVDLVSGAVVSVAGAAYTAVAPGPTVKFSWASADAVALTAPVANAYLQGNAGNDTLTALAGNNVLDGGRGSNLLVGTGGDDGGKDRFFADLRGGASTFNTVVNFHKGDVVTLWGFTAGVGALRWLGSSPIPDQSGATVRASVTGVGAATTLTFANFSLNDLKAQTSVTTGSENGTAFLRFTNHG